MKINFSQNLIVFTCILYPKIIESTDNGGENRIFKGHNAAIGDFPYMVSLQIWSKKSKTHVCGGSLINENTIISAGHCFSGKKVPNYAVACDIEKLGDNSYRQERRISTACIHPKYKTKNRPFILTYDFAIVRTYDRFTFTENCYSIDVANKNSAIGIECTVAGWGDRFMGDDGKTTILQYGKTHIVSSDKCSQFMNKYDSNIMTCVGDSETSACQGDSGGPLICNNQIEGVVSFGSQNCADLPYVVFAKVPAVYAWILDHLSYEVCDGYEVSDSITIEFNLKVFIFSLIIFI